MKFGIGFANTGPFASGPGAVKLAAAAEAAGFESLWTVEHVVYPEGYESVYPYGPSGKMPGSGRNPIPDPLAWLGHVAAATSEIRLATGISLLAERHPLVFAKEVATVDSMSGGRVELGIGVGWLREEFDALGVPWARRGARTEEYLEVMRRVWAEDDVSFEGEFVSFERVSSNPKPPAGRVPVHIGGHSPAAARRAGRVGDGFFPAEGDVASLVRMARTEAAEAGRDPASIEITTFHPGLLGDDPAAAVAEAESWGAHRLLVPAFRYYRHTEEALAEFAGSVIRPGG